MATIGEYRQLQCTDPSYISHSPSVAKNLLSFFNRIPDMKMQCKSAKDVLVGLSFLLAMERMFTSGKNLD